MEAAQGSTSRNLLFPLAFLLQLLAAVLFSHPQGATARTLSSPLQQSQGRFHLYVWAGPASWTTGQRDTLQVYDVQPQWTQRRPALKWEVKLQTVGNEPHHMAFTKDRRFLFAGGLLSFAKGLPSLYFFRTSKNHAPRLIRADTPKGCTAADAGVTLPDGGLLITMMGGPGGGPGGQLLVYNKDIKLVAQFPPNAQQFENLTGSGFSPHGIAVSNDGKYIFSSDFLVPISLVPAANPDPDKGVKRWGSLRMFDAKTLELLTTFNTGLSMSNMMGLMDVAWVNTCAIATSTSMGVLYCADPVTRELTVAYDFEDESSLPQISITNAAQNIVYTTVLGQDKVVKLDASNPKKMQLLGETQLPTGASPHVLVLSPDESLLIISDYFLDLSNVGGVIQTPSDNKVRFIRTSDMVELPGMRINFNTAVSKKVPFRPHGMAIYPL